MISLNIARSLETLIPHFYKLLRSEKAEYFKNFSLTPTQYDVLLPLSVKNFTLSDLADEVLLDSSTLVGIISRLEKSGLVKKKISGTDRRKNIISITPQGQELLDSIPLFVSPTLRVVVEGLSQEEGSNMEEIMKKIVKNLELTEFIPFEPESGDKGSPSPVPPPGVQEAVSTSWSPSGVQDMGVIY